jgi:two-component system OmpR family sensor kinase
MKTLRKQLTLTLLVTMTLSWIAVFAFQQYEATRSQTGARDQWLHDAASQMLASLPVSLLGNEAPSERFTPPASSRVDGDKVRFHLWSLADRRLLLRSPESPAQPLSGGFQDGYFDVRADGVDWRVYAISDAQGRVQVQVARPQSELRAQSLYSLKRGLLIVSVLFVLLAVVSWMVVGRAFRKVDRAGVAIARRGPFDLAPLPMAGMPGELRPFIRSINQLLLRVKGGMDRERRFLEDAAHELRTPLAALSAHAELVARSAGSGDAPAAIEKLRLVAQRTSRLSEQLLDQARMDALSASADEPELVELDALVAMLVRDWESDATRKQLRIQLDVQAIRRAAARSWFPADRRPTAEPACAWPTTDRASRRRNARACSTASIAPQAAPRGAAASACRWWRRSRNSMAPRSRWARACAARAWR